AIKFESIPLATSCSATEAGEGIFQSWKAGENMTQQYVTHKHIFTSLVRELNQLLDGEVIITNEAGVIMASTDSKRVGTIHVGAKIAMETSHRLNMTGERCR